MQILVICLQIWSWTSWSRILVVQLNFFFDIHVIYIVSDILTNFYQDPIIRSTKKSLVTDTCNKSPVISLSVENLNKDNTHLA